MKPTQALPGSPRVAVSFAVRYTHHIGLVPIGSAPATITRKPMGLLDQAHSFAQGASNGVAGSLTGPVDGLAWLLRKAGVPVPQAPFCLRLALRQAARLKGRNSRCFYPVANALFVFLVARRGHGYRRGF